MRLQPLPIVAGFAALALIVGARAVLVESQRANRAAARETIEYQEQLSGLLSLAQDAESSQRGYLLTGEKSYLEPYRKAVEAIPGQLARIESAATPDDQIVQQISHIKEALSQEQAELSQTIALYDRGDAAKALQLVRSGQGKAAMDEIRASMDTIRRIGAAAVAARDEQTDRIEAWLRIGSLAALLAIFLLGVCTIRQSRRRFRDVLVVQEELMRKNIELGNEIQTRENAESQMRQMQKMEAVGQLTGGIAHDFNNMLAVILSAMNLAQRKLKRGEHDIEKLVEAATDAASRAANLTSRLLAFSRLQPLALAGGLWKIHADPNQLENAILNLAVNARDAMDNDGKLTIETVNSHLDEAYASTHAELAPGQYVMIAVTDTGAGMSPEVIAKAFEPFF
ncbi:MAG: histidine kinase, partial [Mesorhizobium sp.]